MSALAAIPLWLPLRIASWLAFDMAPAVGACVVGGWICARVMRR